MHRTSWTLLVFFAGAVGCRDASTPAPPPPPPAFDCGVAADCAYLATDAGPCHVPQCQPGTRTCELVAVADNTPCDDQDACTTGERCGSGGCMAMSARTCDDDNGCTDDSCDPSDGCVFTNNATVCDDGNGCTEVDTCAGGACVAGNNICPCATTPDCGVYEDGDLCNGTLVCNTAAVPSVCDIDPPSVVTCAPGGDTECRSNQCEASTGNCQLTSAPDDTPCSDGDACTSGDACSSGTCSSSSAATCDDGTPCTDDSCLSSVGCIYLGNGSCGSCAGLDCLGCAYGVDCAAAGTPIGTTCCSGGDTLAHIGSGYGAEVVDIEVDDDYAYLCGGFGVRISRVTSPTAPQYLSSSSNIVPRCQRIGIGPLIGNTRVFYLAHHGDSWVRTPALTTAHIDTTTDAITTIGSIEDPAILFEGLAWSNGFLLVAAHAGGVRVYQTSSVDGRPSLVTTVGGFINAWKIAIAGDVAYVADGDGGLRVLSVADPAAPTIVQSLPTTGLARDVVADGSRVYVALGGDGVDVFDATTPDNLSFVQNLDGQGSVQAVAADQGLLALASWSHVALHDSAQLNLIGTEDLRLYPSFDQVLGVATRADLIFAGEWEGLHVLQYRPGYVGADIWIEEELLDFPAEETSARAVIVRNRGVLDLAVTNIVAADPDMFSVDKTSMTIAPGAADVVEVTYQPPSSGLSSIASRLVFATNDPDAGHSPLELHLIARQNSQLNVGDNLEESSANFGFLDLSGAGQLDALRGQVTVLAYFALF